jgi:hypothetical protein
VFVEELYHWDGAVRGDTYFSVDRVNVDWAQIAICLTGRRCSTGEVKNPNSPRGKAFYVVTPAKRRLDCARTTYLEKTFAPYEGLVYSVRVPSSYVLVRRNGRISVSGD